MDSNALYIGLVLVVVVVVLALAAYYYLSKPATTVPSSAASFPPTSAPAAPVFVAPAAAGGGWELGPGINAHNGLGPEFHVKYGDASTPEGCHKVCAGNAECVAYSYTPAGTCWGRNASAPNTWVPQAGYYSGRRI